MLLTLEPLLDDFTELLFYDNQVVHGTFLCVEFDDRWPNSLGRKESQRNHRSGRIRVSLAPLNKYRNTLLEKYKYFQLVYGFIFLIYAF